MTTERYKEHHSGSTVFMPSFLRAQMVGLMEAIGSNDLLKPLRSDDPGDISGDYYDDCVRNIQEWLNSFGPAELQVTNAANKTDRE